MTIVDMLGVAMGCIGMSYSDFCQCTPFEFSSIIVAWRREQERLETQELYRMRYVAFCSLRPYSKGLNKPEDLFTLPGETKNKPPQLTTEERMARRRAAMAARGITDDYHQQDGERNQIQDKH